jgi:hypothetical protein
MTITAIDAELSDVVSVAERYRLDEGEVRFGDVRGAIENGGEPAQSGGDEDGAEDRHLGNGVEASVKNLRHRGRLIGKPRAIIPARLCMKSSDAEQRAAPNPAEHGIEEKKANDVPMN